jgi:hypothetical protein
MFGRAPLPQHALLCFEEPFGKATSKFGASTRSPPGGSPCLSSRDEQACFAQSP